MSRSLTGSALWIGFAVLMVSGCGGRSQPDGTGEPRQVVLQVTGMMKSKSGAT